MPAQRRGQQVGRTAAGRARRRYVTVVPFLLAWLLGGSFVGCGSRTMVGGVSEDDPRDDFGSDDVIDSDNPGGRGGAAQTPAPSTPAAPIDVGGVLPACEPGFERSSAAGRDCTYVFGSSCYEDARVACACACRGLANSACIIDGFLDPDSPQGVRCTAR